MVSDPAAAASPARILLIRGGAIGDFLLTIPAIALLRENFPDARLEILGYPHITGMAVAAGLADAVRPLETAALARFFGDPRKTPALDPDWSAYFAGFNLVVSHLFDPDGFFAANLRRAGVQRLVESVSKVDPAGAHAARQLARGLESLALYLEDPAVRLCFDRGEDMARVAEFQEDSEGGRPPRPAPLVLHPGSGSPRKNWPPERWAEVVTALFADDPGLDLLLVGGEADEAAMGTLTWALPPGRVTRLHGAPLPTLGAVVSRARLFLGHDSGISHLAAATGCPCLLLFGPTDPDVWAPPHPGVRVLRAPGGNLTALDVATVRGALEETLGRGPRSGGRGPA